jgi:hypothetical protein
VKASKPSRDWQITLHKKNGPELWSFGPFVCSRRIYERGGRNDLPIKIDLFNYLESKSMDRIICPFEVKLNQRGDDEGIFSGYGSTFGNVDSYGDTIAPGAFKKTIADAKNGNAPWPAMLSQHGGNDPTPVGIWSHMSEDEHGLKLKGKLEIKNKRGAIFTRCSR